MPKILVTGGCGYIGSHTMVDLIDHGCDVVSIDSLFNADENVLDGIEQITGIKVVNHKFDLCDAAATRAFFSKEKNIDGIIHFAALKSVEESVFQPIRYFKNNIGSLLNVLEAMKDFDIPHLIFSSSCTVYGNAEELPVTEDTPFARAESPYGRTKQISEHILQDFAIGNPQIDAIALRYFNPAGAHESALIGEAPSNPATNLVPVITETGIGKRTAAMTVFGSDYPTRDGTCIRDYIHVMDLANAHTIAMQYLMDGKQESNFEVYNLGIGKGATVLEAIQAFEKVSGQPLNYTLGPRRPGDVVAIYSNHDLITKRLGWKPKHNMDDIMQTAWAWEKYNAK